MVAKQADIDRLYRTLGADPATYRQFPLLPVRQPATGRWPLLRQALAGLAPSLPASAPRAVAPPLPASTAAAADIGTAGLPPLFRMAFAELNGSAAAPAPARPDNADGAAAAVDEDGEPFDPFGQDPAKSCPIVPGPSLSDLPPAAVDMHWPDGPGRRGAGALSPLAIPPRDRPWVVGGDARGMRAGGRLRDLILGLPGGRAAARRAAASAASTPPAPDGAAAASAPPAAPAHAAVPAATAAGPLPEPASDRAASGPGVP